MRLTIALLLTCFLLRAADDRVLVDNAIVRVLKDVRPVRRPNPESHRWNRVLVYLDPADVAIAREGGRKDVKHWKAGDVEWSPTGPADIRENAGSSPIRVIEIEIKQPPPVARPRSELDPVRLDPVHNIVLLETPRVRVFRSWREAGATEMMHEHTGAGRLSVLLTSMDASVKTPDGTVTPVRANTGDVLWSGPVTHATTNLGPEKFEMIVVEIR